MNFRRARRALAAYFVITFLGGAAAYASAAPEGFSGDATRGKALYQACSGCHSLDDNDIGPKHRGVVGRQAGTVADYAYSPALKASGLTWDPANLDRWLTNPQALVPGTKMYFLLADPQSRADIIAYLVQQK
jgi:cytochrome c